MRDIWYADKRDLIKWTTLYHLAHIFKGSLILQIAFYRKEKQFGKVIIDGQEKEIPKEVISHFRDIHKIRDIKFQVPVEVFDLILEYRHDYLIAVIERLQGYRKKLIVFLDPDTGLQPKQTKSKTRPKPEHVSEEEVKKIWDELKPEDVFVLYQHQTNRNGKSWIEPKKIQLANALGLSGNAVKLAYGPDVAKDVVFFYAQRLNSRPHKKSKLLNLETEKLGHGLISHSLVNSSDCK